LCKAGFSLGLYASFDSLETAQVAFFASSTNFGLYRETKTVQSFDNAKCKVQHAKFKKGTLSFCILHFALCIVFAAS
jgi:hypothetical protein